MSLHVLGGKLRGRSLQTPRGSRTRPTTSMLRKAVFDILQETIQEALFLDLFAGSGAMGIEALSRGAAHATFVENDRHALRAMDTNLEKLKLKDQATVYATSVEEALKKLSKEGKCFHVIYADPPYHLASLYQEVLTWIDTSPLLIPGGRLFLESLAPALFENIQFKSLMFKDKRRFGSSILHQFKN